MNGSPPPPGPMSRILSEEDAFRQMSPIDQLRAPSPQIGPEQAAANRQQNLRDLLSIVPGPGNVIAAEDAVTQGGEAVGAFGEGRYGRAALHGGLGALSAFGAVTGLPTGRMAGNAAKGAQDTLFSGAGPTSSKGLTVSPHPDMPKIGKYDHLVAREGDNQVASLSGRVLPDNPAVFEIFNIQSPGRHSLGTTAMRQIMTAIRDRYPGIEHVSGYRVSGARPDAAEALVKLPPRRP